MIPFIKGKYQGIVESWRIAVSGLAHLHPVLHKVDQLTNHDPIIVLTCSIHLIQGFIISLEHIFSSRVESLKALSNQFAIRDRVMGKLRYDFLK
jgi:hypothetical protein